VDYCWSLYQSGEKIGMEKGVNLNLADGKLVIGDEVFQGIATGINIDNEAGFDNFGDLHCHPSNSVGHLNGYAAHSPEDFIALRNNTGKPVFIRFVASGTHIYAAIYRSGHSKLDEKEIVRIRDGNAKAARKFFDEKCLVDEEARNDAMLKMNSGKQHEQYILLRKRETPGSWEGNGKTLDPWLSRDRQVGKFWVLCRGSGIWRVGMVL
jgi:hypothetical protein